MKSLVKTNRSIANTAIKKVKFYSLSTTVIIYMLLAFSTLTSCSKDDSPITPEEEAVVNPDILPSLTLVSGSEDLFKGVVGAPGFGSLQHTVKATAPEGFVALNIYKVVDGVQSSYISFDINSPNYVDGSNTYTHNLSYIFTEIDIDKDLYFIAEVIDSNNNVETLDFAEAEVKDAMQYVETIFMETRLPAQPDNMSIAQFMQVDGLEVGGVNLNRVINEQINDKIAAVISVNEVDGIYISSASAVGNTDIVDDIQNKSNTKFKEINDETTNFNTLNIYDTFEIESLYNNASFNEHQEKMKNIGQDKLYAMKTDDNRIALFKVTYYEVINNSEVYMTMDMYITQ
ncbi:hypothetical protein [uncultured Psychroserpens sp.]|uniref:hypothetical protein n=1 Tax=uncultured Psychroserpens sp. TaxID=255436 RepID=UPI00260F0686|nr:hypothetical protein [uncultured Psychroserpens sp.]